MVLRVFLGCSRFFLVFFSSQVLLGCSKVFSSGFEDVLVFFLWLLEFLGYSRFFF